MTNISGLVWLILIVGALSIIQRRLHLETQALFYFLTRRKEIALILFSLLFLPGVLLHECSHYLMACLLGVRTGRFSLIPKLMADGRIRLGFVETGSTDIFRDALIGIAPLLTGGAFVVYAGMRPLGLSVLWGGIMDAEYSTIWTVLTTLHSRPDFWLWFYLAFAVSSTMIPSASDRRAWLPVSLLFIVLFILLIFVNISLGLVDSFGEMISYFNRGLHTVTLVFAVSLIVHGLVFPVVWILRNTLTHLSGLKLVKG